MKRPWMPLYVDDYQRDTNRLTTIEHGAYLLLIMEYWRHGELPDDERALARIARLTDREWGKVRGSISQLFREGWRHKRIDEELAKAQHVSERRKAAAEESWNKRNASADAYAHANASAQQDANAHTRALSRDTLHNSHTSKTSLDVGGPAKPAPKRASRLSADWQPSEADRTFAHERGLTDADIAFEAEKIRNWSAGSQNGARLDWAATWRNWILDRKPSPRAGPNGSQRRTWTEIAFSDLPHDQRTDHQPPAKTARAADPAVSGFAGRLSEPDRDHAGGELLDLGPADAAR